MSKKKATGYGKKGAHIYDATDESGSGHKADAFGNVNAKKDHKGWLD